MRFTTRPELRGTFGMVASTHWIASAVGFGILERGGNAFDAAVATGLVLQVVEPHLNGPGGEFPAILHHGASGRTEVLCAQGTAPAAATIAHYRDQGLEAIPGAGLLATVIPGAFDGWMLMLRDHGTMALSDVMAPAIHYARHGHPVLPRVSDTIAGLARFFAAEWPSSAATWLPGGTAPAPGALFANRVLADTYDRLVQEAQAARGREAGIEAARRAWSQGFVAARIDAFLRDGPLCDAMGNRHGGVLTGQDMAGWQARYEPPLTRDYHGWQIAKTGPWGQGPVLLQCLSLLKDYDLEALDPNGPDFVHLVIEAMKLAFADREAFYGDPDFCDIPMDRLLSETHAETRRALISDTASHDQRPSELPGFERWAEAAIARAAARIASAEDRDAAEPTMAHLAQRPGDTVHLDVADRWGNMVTATPSGGWLQSSPVVPGLGFALNTRAQMFWLDEGLPQSLRPGARPRTTLSPSLARHPDHGALAFGTPGGDQQDQWQLIFLLRHLHHGLNLQEAIDAPLFHSQHFTSSFFPRTALPGRMMAEPGLGDDTLAALRARGHVVTVAEPWSVGRLTAAARDAGGLLRAAASPRLMQAYAIGR